MQTLRRTSMISDDSMPVGLRIAPDPTVPSVLRAETRQRDGLVQHEWGLPRRTYYVPSGYAIIGCSSCNEVYALPEELVLGHRRVTATRVDGATIDENGFLYCSHH